MNSLARQFSGSTDRSGDDTLSVRQYEDFSRTIEQTLGIKMPPSKRTMLQCRLLKRMRLLGISSLAEYHQRFFSQPEMRRSEMEHFLNLATTNKSDFYREPDHFEILARSFIPRWLQRHPCETLQVWSAGCSTGEEPYTLAMTLLEAGLVRTGQFRILATDVSTRVLEIARSAMYAETKVEPLPPVWRPKYLLRGTGENRGMVKIAPRVRSTVRFGILNFLAPDYGIRERMDVVFFRNVMIYFPREIQAAVLHKIFHQMNPGGWLFISHAETLQGHDLPFAARGPAVYERQEEVS